MHFSLRSDQKVPQRRLYRWTWKNYGRCSWPEGTYTCPSMPWARFHATLDCAYLQNGEVCAFSSAQCKLTLKWHINSCVMTVTSKYFWDFILEWSLHTWAHSELTMNFQVYLVHCSWVGKHRGWSLMDEVQTTELHLPTLVVLCIPEASSDVLAHWDLGSK